MSRPPLHALQGFVTAARSGNLSRAADSLHLTVSALSHQIRRQFGAGTAASEFVPPLGNRAASRRAFGTPAKRPTQLPETGCVAGGCG